MQRISYIRIMKKLAFIFYLFSVGIFAQAEISYRFDEEVVINIKSDSADYQRKMYLNRLNSNVFGLSYGEKLPLEICDYSLGKAFIFDKNYDTLLHGKNVIKGVYMHQTKFEQLREHYSKNRTERTYEIIEGNAGIDTLIITLHSQYKKRKNLQFSSKTIIVFTKSSTDYWQAFDHILNSTIAIHAPLKLPFPIKILSFTEEVINSKSENSTKSGILEYKEL